MKLKNNLSKSEECVDTEPSACTDLECYDSSEFFGSSNGICLNADHTYLTVKQKSLGR